MSLGESVDTTAEAAVLNVRLSPFLFDHPDVWFLQIQSIFSLDTTTPSLRLMSESSLNSRTSCSRHQNKYNTLKQKVLSYFSDTQERKLQKMLNELQLGTMKPSQLYRKICRLAAGQATEEIIRVKWLALLPSHIQNMLKNSSIDDLTTLADELHETTSSHSACSTSFTDAAHEDHVSAASYARKPPESLEIRSSLAQLAVHVKTMTATVSQLSSAISELTSKVDRLSHTSVTTSHTDHRRPRSRSPKQSAPDVCYYHRRYGANAMRCITPCAFKLPSPAQGN